MTLFIRKIIPFANNMFNSPQHIIFSKWKWTGKCLAFGLFENQSGIHKIEISFHYGLETFWKKEIIIYTLPNWRCISQINCYWTFNNQVIMLSISWHSFYACKVTKPSHIFPELLTRSLGTYSPNTVPYQALREIQWAPCTAFKPMWPLNNTAISARSLSRHPVLTSYSILVVDSIPSRTYKQ